MSIIHARTDHPAAITSLSPREAISGRPIARVVAGSAATGLVGPCS